MMKARRLDSALALENLDASGILTSATSLQTPKSVPSNRGRHGHQPYLSGPKDALMYD